MQRHARNFLVPLPYKSMRARISACFIYYCIPVPRIDPQYIFNKYVLDNFIKHNAFPSLEKPRGVTISVSILDIKYMSKYLSLP